MLTEMEEITDDYINCVHQYSKESDRDSILQDLIVAHSNELVQVLDDFKEKYKETMVVTDFFDTMYTLQAKTN